MTRLGRGSEQIRLVDLNVDRWVAKLPRSWLLMIGGRRVIVPFSNCEFDEDEGTVTMPEWLAIEKELI